MLFDNRLNIMMLLGIVTSIAFAVEIYFGIVSNSLALITDSIHTLMDAAVVFVALIAARIAIRPASAKHTYGYGKMEPLGFVLSGVAILVVVGFFIHEALFRLEDLTPHVPSMFGIWGGIFVIFTEIFKIFVLRKAMKGFGGETFKADMQHCYVDIGTTVLTVLSIPLTIAGIFFMDSAASLILGVLLGWLSIKIVYKACLELLDVTSPKLVEDIKATIESIPDVIKVGPVLLRRSGQLLFADATAIVRGDTSVDKAHSISEVIEDSVRKRVIGNQLSEEHAHGLSSGITEAKLTIRVEPDWTDIPINSRIHEIVKNIDDVLDASHVNTHDLEGKMYVDLRVKVQKDISLTSTYEISNRIEAEIKEHFPKIESVTIRLEPYDDLSTKSIQKADDVEALIRSTLDKHHEILGTIKILSLKFGNVYKIDIDCMLDGENSIEQTHRVLVEIEHELLGELKNAIITIHPVPI